MTNTNPNTDLGPCASGRPYKDCCEPVITGARAADTAEELMRGRYSAYATGVIEFILSSTIPDRRGECDEKAIRAWSANSDWTSLEIASTSGGQPSDTEGSVEFIARFTENRIKKVLHETGTFKKVDGKWYYFDGTIHPPKPFVREDGRVNRNDPCPCGSGKKYKKCCMDKKE
jgi:SEC-C motif-containing protein